MKKFHLLLLLFSTVTFLVSCDNDVPGKENEEELIDKVTLTFTPTGGSPVIVTATDPDGEGPADLAPDGAINLASNTAYTLTITVENTIENEDITEEIEEEADEHLFLFGFTNNIFLNPTGDGNIDNRSDIVNYNDEDSNELDLGLSTNWYTAGSSSDGSFRVVLKHQPGIKSSSSTVADGTSDIDITWVINISDITRQ